MNAISRMHSDDKKSKRLSLHDLSLNRINPNAPYRRTSVKYDLPYTCDAPTSSGLSKPRGLKKHCHNRNGGSFGCLEPADTIEGVVRNREDRIKNEQIELLVSC